MNHRTAKNQRKTRSPSSPRTVKVRPKAKVVEKPVVKPVDDSCQIQGCGCGK